jgi:hypothetical protein
MLNLVVVVALFGTGASPAAFGRSSTSQTVLPPQPPRSCNIPPGAVTVRTATQLQSELAKKTPQDIAIPPGDYAPSTVLKPAAPHRLWGTHANDVTVRAGFLFTGAGAPGFEVHCLTLDVPNVNKADRRSGTAIINSARRWTDITIADSRLLGNGKVGRAVFAQVPNGLTVERVEIRGFTRDGIRAKTGSGRVILRDLDIRDIERPGPATYNGTAEAGIFMDTAATIERVRVRDAYWMGIGTYANDITIRDLDVDGSIVGVYLEHYTHRLVLEYFHIGPDNKKGINFESENPARYKGGPTTVDALIQDGVVEAHRVGAAVNDGQKNPTIRRVTFRGQCGAAIVANRPRSTGEVYVDNDFSGIRPGAVEMTSKHSNAFKCG